jgi:hypothetical protein
MPELLNRSAIRIRQVGMPRSSLFLITGSLIMALAVSGCPDRVPEADTPERHAFRDQSEIDWGIRTPDPAYDQPNSGRIVEVGLTEYQIVMPDTLTPGVTDFAVVNRGEVEHSLVIEGRGVRARLLDPPGPGETMWLRLVLEPGFYVVWCPVGDHEAEHEMRKHLVVLNEGFEPEP